MQPTHFEQNKLKKTEHFQEEEAISADQRSELGVGIDFDKIDSISKETKTGIDATAEAIFSGNIDLLQAAEIMGRLTRQALTQIAEEFAHALKKDASELPFAIFLFGSTARNLMLPNSDVDVILVFEENCPDALKSMIKKCISLLPFDDIEDIEQWDSVDSMKKENCPSMMRVNKAVEARFVTGNINISQQHKELIIDRDTKSDKEKRFMTEYWLLHKVDYRSRGSEHGMNLKYDFGASRDIVFLDWYYLLASPETLTQKDQPTIRLCLDYLLEKGQINETQHQDVMNAVKLILLVKFSLWDENRRTDDEKLLYLSDYSLAKCYQNTEELFNRRGIHNADELTFSYNQAKGKLHTLVANLYENIASHNKDSIKILNSAKEKDTLDDEVLEILKNPTWHELVPFAIQSTSPEILEYIVKRFSNSVGFEYILRLISQNKYITHEIIQDLLSSRLDERIKKKLEAAA